MSGDGMMTPEDIRAALPYPERAQNADALGLARARMEATGQWHPRQSMGRRWAIGCVALEITQRCNLDCTLCYLSDHSEAVKDLPIEAVFERIDMIRAHYGANTDVQITGGDPTLRRRDELVAIVRRVRERGMRPSLFTNGIKATRDLLMELCDAGLVDVAFHVDMTQERQGYHSEVSLNAIRAAYIERARGLPISVFFNTTVCDANFHEIPNVAAFFVANADVVRFASFQLQANTGRGTMRARRQPINIESVAAQLRAGADAPINFETPIAGHGECNRYALTLVADRRVRDLYGNGEKLATIMAATAGIQFDRKHPRRAMMALALGLARRPGAALRLLPWALGRAWAMRRDIWAARGRVHKLSFFIHNFMDAEHLACERINACVFMVATQDGPISMCLHNAKRDSFILKPIALEGGRLWDPLTGKGITRPDEAATPRVTRKTARGRRRIEIDHRHGGVS